MLKVGLIGVGSIAKSHLNAYTANPYAKIVAIADIIQALAKLRAEEFGIERCYTDYKKSWTMKKIDAVSIVTPTLTHSSITVEALKAGKPPSIRSTKPCI